MSEQQGTRRGATVGAYLLAELIVLAITMAPLLGQPWWRGMRNVFPLDPLTYAAIATNVTQGHWALTEPFTLTGVSHYPSGWYLLIGAVAAVSNLPVYVVWTILGVGIVSAAVLIVGWTAQRISGRPWATVLPALALLTGTMSTFVASNWYSPLGEHGVLWGPFVSLYVLNAEAAGVSIAMIALSLLVVSLHDPGRTSTRRNTVVAGVLIGLLANIHTYSFFTAVFLATAFIAIHELITRPSRTRIALTTALPLIAIALGPWLNDRIGPLPLFAVLIAGFAPALISAARRHVTTSLLAATGFAFAASPQIVWTLVGLASKDPFLLYRQESTRNLGILHASTVAAAIVWLLVIATIVAVGRKKTPPALAALTASIAIAWVVLPLNDLWGFTQEPYRFWLQLSLIGGPLLMIPFAAALAQRAQASTKRRTAITLLASVTAIAWLISLADVVGFQQYAREQGVIDLHTPKADAIRQLTQDKDGLLMTSECLSPRELKLITGGPVAEYNLGLAWPTDEPAFRIFDDPGRRAGEDPVALQAAGVKYVLTDSACATDWRFPTDQRLVTVSVQQYEQGGVAQRLTLWRVNPI